MKKNLEAAVVSAAEQIKRPNYRGFAIRTVRGYVEARLCKVIVVYEFAFDQWREFTRHDTVSQAKLSVEFESHA